MEKLKELLEILKGVKWYVILGLVIALALVLYFNVDLGQFN
ncbi:hypothetical protein LCGC14_0500900 [marine sediment metagenome]|uniref:Uncharacterized protein n=1 Tax=marine sediment metagenome TaxID=412755 RepID=A0A0F9S3T9_9ZZZZ